MERKAQKNSRMFVTLNSSFTYLWISKKPDGKMKVLGAQNMGHNL